MNTLDSGTKALMLKFFKVRAEDKKINNTEEYEKYLYKVIVDNLTVFHRDTIQNFEYLTWMAALEYYELEQDMPRELSRLRFDLRYNRDKPESLIDTYKDTIFHQYHLPKNFRRISSYGEYEYHLYKVIYEVYPPNNDNDEGYNYSYWGYLVRLYELENKLPKKAAELGELERRRGIRRARQNGSLLCG